MSGSGFGRVSLAVASLLALAASVFASLRGGEDDAGGTTIVFTVLRGDYVAACGCTGVQIGGIANESTALKKLSSNLGSTSPHLVDLGPTSLSLGTIDVFASYFKQAGFEYVVADSPTPDIARKYEGALNKNGVPHLSPEYRGSRLVPLRGTSHYLMIVKGYDRRRDAPELKTLDSLSEDSRVLIVVDHGQDADSILEDAPSLKPRSTVLSRDTGVFGDKDPEFERRPFPRKGELLIITIGSDGGFKIRRNQVTTATSEDPVVKELVADYYEKLSEKVKVVGDSPKRLALFTSAKTCGDCHAQEYGQWMTTQHAHAVQTLVAAHKEVDECLSCHSLAYQKTKIYDTKDDRVHESVTCESCHGSGSRHSYTQLSADIVRRPRREVCTGCHAKTQDPGFDFVAKLKKVAHRKTSALPKE